MANKKIKRSTKRNIKNALMAISGISIGLVAAIGGTLLLLERNDIIERNQLTLNHELQQCKALGAKKGFRLVEEEKGNVTFYHKQLKADNSFSNIIAFQDILSSCPTMELTKACIGWSCDLDFDEKIKEDTKGMPFYFSMKEIYTRSDL